MLGSFGVFDDHGGGAGSASGANDGGRGFDGLGDSRSQGGFDNSAVGQNTGSDKGSLASGIASLFGMFLSSKALLFH